MRASPRRRSSFRRCASGNGSRASSTTTSGRYFDLAAIQSDAVAAEIKRANYDLAESQVERLRAIVKEAHEDLRGFVYDLRDREYAETSIEDLVARQVASFESCCLTEVRNGLTGTDGFLGLDARQKKEIVLIMKEALNNVAKHADADIVRIDAELQPGISR